MSKIPKNTHLIFSSIIVILAAFVYGGSPSKILPYIFEFEVEVLELKNIFRAIMGLYFAFAIYWLVGVYKPNHWENATITNVLFMSGLVFGRVFSTLVDGVSIQFSVGLLGEIILLTWGWYNLKSINVYNSND